MSEKTHKKKSRIVLIITICIGVSMGIWMLTVEPFKSIIFTEHPTPEDYSILETAAIEFSHSFDEKEIEEKYSDVDVSYTINGDILEVNAISKLYKNEVIAKFPITYKQNSDGLSLFINYDLAMYEQKPLSLTMYFVSIIMGTVLLPMFLYIFLDDLLDIIRGKKQESKKNS